MGRILLAGIAALAGWGTMVAALFAHNTPIAFMGALLCALAQARIVEVV